MKKILSPLVLVLILTAVVGADSGFAANPNGLDWVTWDAGRKDSFIQGFMAGSNHVVWNNLKKPVAFDEEESRRVLKKYSLIRGGRSKAGFEIDEVTFLRDMAVFKTIDAANEAILKYVVYNSVRDKLSKGLDEFYRNRRNRSIKLTDAVFFVQKRLAGASEEELKGILSELRSVNGETLFVKGGKIRRASFP